MFDDYHLYYRFCRLRKGTLQQRTWIPEEYAVAGRTLKIRDAALGHDDLFHEQEWDDGWVVDTVGTKRQTGHTLDCVRQSQKTVLGWKASAKEVRRCESNLYAKYGRRT
jgi:hypothetical protein